ncbi:hypothetical protein C8D88_12430 [Lentzea atacamensis]|uniref:Uncharacterized protein n=1 Tax=Lentzea atacamensis TaxID=531938 RepID=A0A316HHA2_9PSEU|nr:hypothetical protein [Lentzea atacamensis]PWK79503.1 hypothetical protein C8D88_12430 [Lentzea atacamensis]
MKRWLWAAALLPVVGVAVWLVPDSVDVVVITAIHPDGTVEWVDAEIRPAEENSSNVHELSQDRHVSKLAEDVVIRTAVGCGTPSGLQLSRNGLGAVECGRADFLAMQSPPYAPRLTFNGDGEITEVAGRYHP